MHAPKLLLLLLIAFAASAPALAQKSLHEQRTVAFDANGRVVISNYRGTIDVTTWDRAEAHVDVTVEGDDDSSDRTDIIIDASPANLRVETETRASRSLWGFGGVKSRPVVHIKVTVPHAAQVAIRDYRSDIRISGLTRGVDVETYRGSIQGKDLSGTARIETYRGEVVLSDIRGGARVDTYRGKVRAHFAALEDDVRIETYRGDIELDLPKSASFRVDAEQSRRARITSDFHLSADGAADRIVGDVNGGGPVISFRTYRGSLALHAR